MTKKILLNPNNPAHHELLRELIRQKNPAEYVLRLDTYSVHQLTFNNQPMNVCLLAPVFEVLPANRTTTRLFATYNSSLCGEGTFGKVFPATLLKFDATAIRYKYNYVLKALNIEKVQPNKRNQYVSNYGHEQWIGSFVPHIKSKYPVEYLDKHTLYLLMKKVPGVNLDVFIEEVKKNTRKITILERYQLSLNLLQAYQQQCLDIVEKKGEQSQHLFHQDIKPLNCMVDDFLNVKLIDYGASGFPGDPFLQKNKGTAAYMSPETLLSWYGRVAPQYDDIDELFSVVMTLIEVWGGDPRSLIEDFNWETLIEQNKDIPMSLLLEGIDGLSSHEERELRALFYKSTRVERERRISYAQILQIFKQLIAYRIDYERKLIEELTNESIEKLSSAKLYQFLKSPHVEMFLDKLKGNNALVLSLRYKISAMAQWLDESTLIRLNQLGINLQTMDCLQRLILDKQISQTQLEKLLKLGFPLPDNFLSNWLHQTRVPDSYWVMITRVLVKSRPDVRLPLALDSSCSEAVIVFCQHLLSDEYYSADDCIHLLERHLKLVERSSELKIYLKDLLDKKDNPQPLKQLTLHYLKILDDNQKELILSSQELDEAKNLINFSWSYEEALDPKHSERHFAAIPDRQGFIQETKRQANDFMSQLIHKITNDIETIDTYLLTVTKSHDLILSQRLKVRENLDKLYSIVLNKVKPCSEMLYRIVEAEICAAYKGSDPCLIKSFANIKIDLLTDLISSLFKLVKDKEATVAEQVFARVGKALTLLLRGEMSDVNFMKQLYSCEDLLDTVAPDKAKISSKPDAFFTTQSKSESTHTLDPDKTIVPDDDYFDIRDNVP